MDLELIWLLLLLPAGFVAGVANVVAGGGSFLTLPLLIALGLPVHVANGTNRISVVLQGAFAAGTYQKRGEFDFALYKQLLPALLLGALSGAGLATQIDPEGLRRTFGVVFLAMSVLLLVRSRLKLRARTTPHPLRYFALYLVGAYGGFIQAGVGLWLLLAASSLFSVDTLRANTVKLPLTLTFTVPALLIFLEADMVRWVPGLVLALGTVVGTYVGVRLTVKGGEKLILRAVTLVLTVTGAHLTFF